MELTGIYSLQTHPTLTILSAHSNSKAYWLSFLRVCTSLEWRARLTPYFGFPVPVQWNVVLLPQCPPGPCIPPTSPQPTNSPKLSFAAWHSEFVTAHTCPLDPSTWQPLHGFFTPVLSRPLHVMGSPRSKAPPRKLTRTGQNSKGC